VENYWGEYRPITRVYPRIVGETGGKDFVMVHISADPTKCGGHFPAALSNIKDRNVRRPRGRISQNRCGQSEGIVDEVRVGSQDGFTGRLSNFINAVSIQNAFDSIKEYIVTPGNPTKPNRVRRQVR
jgi:1-pyrroline-5-carboxylate dehydrogenase